MDRRPVTRSGIAGFLRENGLFPRRGLGQHFLVDDRLLAGIVASAAINAGEDLVLEVGPGPGTLTAHLLECGAPVVAVELDPRFRDPVLTRLGRPASLHWIDGDILRSKHALEPAVVAILRSLGAGTSRRLVLVANLPYQIAVPLLVNLLESDLGWRGGAVTVQRELAGRLVATPATRAYGPVSVLIRSAGWAEIVRMLKPGCFVPPPRVASAVVRLAINEGWRGPLEPYEAFRSLVSGLFRYRRKGLSAALRVLAPKGWGRPEVIAVLERLGPGRRAETLEPLEFLELARSLDAGRSGPEPH